MEGSCEYGNEPSGSTSGGEFLDLDIIACSMELITSLPRTFSALPPRRGFVLLTRYNPDITCPDLVCFW
jgi:hypothetical protein